MKTAAEVLGENFKHKGVSNIISKQSLVYKATIKAMKTYATQQTSDLSTQLAKANSDKERLGELLKKYYGSLQHQSKQSWALHEKYLLEADAETVLQTLQDCGITL